MAKKGPATTAEIREWATKKNLQVSPRGRLSSVVIEKFKKSHPTREVA